MENKVKFKIGEIEFEAEGSAEVIEREREVFMNALLPASVEAIVKTRDVDKNTQYIVAEPSSMMLGDTHSVLPLKAGQGQIENIVDFRQSQLLSRDDGAD